MTGIRSIVLAYATRIAVTVVATGLLIGSVRSVACAETITDENVEAALAAAKTAADHEALAAYFTSKSKEAQANVAKHQTMSRLFGGKGKASWEGHCRSLIRTYEEQAKDYAALAKEQSAVAAALAKSK